MRIKPASKAQIRRAAKRKLDPLYWMNPESPRKTGRLSQLSKHNHRVKSEFILMAERIEYERVR